MLMKIHPKGQIVIPAEVRTRLGVEVGDLLEVEIGADEDSITLRRPIGGDARSLAGSLKAFARGRPFPSETEVAGALRRGMTRRG